MKKICFDLRALQIGHQNRGIGMFLKSVLEHLPADENEYLFYCFDKNDPIKDLNISLRIKYKIVTTPTMSTRIDSPKNFFDMIKLIKHRFRPLKEYHPDIFIQPDFALGLPKWRKTKTFVIGYDLIPLIFRHDYIPGITYAWTHSPGKRAKLKAIPRSIYYRIKYRINYKTFKRADQIICISDSTRKSFIDLLHINPKKLTTIPLAPVVSKSAPDYSIANSIKKSYIFYIGGTDSRKRIQDIVFAFNISRSRGSDIALVLAGNEFTEANTVPSTEGRKAILSSPYRQDIHLVGFVTDNQKLALYQKALAFIFTTIHEGFGLPIIEAMHASCPVISYNNSSIPEAAGKAAILVETLDYVGLAIKINELTFDKDKKHIIQAGLKQAEKFSWENYTSSLHDLISS